MDSGTASSEILLAEVRVEGDLDVPEDYATVGEAVASLGPNSTLWVGPGTWPLRADRGLLDTTLVVAMGEFGRTPKINAGAGRDHWPDCYSILLAGGGIKRGFVYGASDDMGAYVTRDPVTPGDLAATIFWAFGIDPETIIYDRSRRPHPIARGRPVVELFG